MTQHPQQTHPLRPGDTLEQYQIIEQIAAGGASTIWRARDTLLGVDVAIKELHLDSSSVDGDHQADGLHDRLQNEIAALAALSDHQPYILRIIQSINAPPTPQTPHTPNGYFIVTEWIDGITLRQAMTDAAAPATVESTLKIMLMTAAALRVMHERSIVHRDLKPDNILLPSAGGLKVCDMGLAALQSEQQAMTLGSVQYMAPQLFQDGPIDGRADLYALGMIAYEMLAGPVGFAEAFASVQRGGQQAMRWIKWHTNPRLTAPALEQINPRVPSWLAQLIARLMEKDPARRIASANQLAKAIRLHVDQSDTASHSPLPGRLAGGNRPNVPPDSGDVSEPGLATTSLAGTGGAKSSFAAAATSSSTHTAPLPHKRFSTPPRRILAAGVAVVALVGGGFWAYQGVASARISAHQHAQALAQFQQAKSQYDSGDFQAAAAAFHKIADPKITADSAITHRALAGQQLAQAQLDLAKGDYAAATTTLNQLQSNSAASREQVRELLDEVSRRAAFAKGSSDIHTAIEQGRVAQARRLMRGWENTSLTPKESKTLNDLRVMLTDQITQQHAQQSIDEADKLIKHGEFSVALTKLKTAASVYTSAKLTEKLKQVEAQTQVIALRAQAARAEAAGNLDKAIALYKQALTLRDNQSIRTMMGKLESQRATQQGEAFAAAGNIAQARVAFTKALGFADNPRARQWLSKLSETQQRDTLIAAGDKAMVSEDYSQAARQYQLAANLRADAALHKKLISAQVHWHIAEGDRAMRDGKFDTAKTAYQKAAHLDDGSAVARKNLTAVDHRLIYQKFLVAGDSLRDKSDFAAAMRAYRQARQAQDTPQIRQRMNDTEFAHLLAQGKSEMAQHHYRQAKAILETASHLRQAPEIQKLLDEINAQLAQ